jgi:hypothetical protein
VIEALALELEEGPTLFVAVTRNVYAVDAVRPVMVIEPEPAWLTVPVKDPGVEVAV